ncbi:MAG: hypothetical protein KGH59_04330 [Candidatus Micrarchaeota archaeon]|nr:hypothetical protein [Candidatus Micrarchaeota archaeon]MDE1846738.1 hypothetical protein [Candidatus Micrarchaeota archaeon]
MGREMGIGILAFAVLCTLAYASQVGQASISAVAVEQLGTGGITTITLNVTNGNGSVSVVGPSSVGNDTLQSAYTAVAYATSYLGLSQNMYNFTYTIMDSNSSVSGPSGGLALTILAISALTHKPLAHNFGVTGTIAPNGYVGQIGGIVEKATAVSDAGKSFIIVPYAANGTFESQLYYITQQNLGMPFVEVSNATQALPYAYGTVSPTSMTYVPQRQNYYVSELPNLNITCNGCDIGAFQNLTNSTLALTTREVNSISGKFTEIKPSFMASLANFSLIASKGYLYTGADLAFLEFNDAYLFANSNLDKAHATTLIHNVSNYCNSLTPPLMTSSNYEFVIGGELRQTWAQITLNDSTNTLTNAQTDDDVASAISQAGTAYAWCFAASNMYGSAAQSNTGFVNISKSSLQDIYSAVSATQKYGTLYSKAAMQDYKQGLYGAALYNVAYVNAFDNVTGYNATQYVLLTNQNLHNASVGIWPYEFSAQALFYLHQALLQQNPLQSNLSIQQAYSVSLLAKQLSAQNSQIVSSFVFEQPSQGAYNQTAISNIQQQVNQIYILMLVIVGLLFVVFVTLVILLARQASQQHPTFGAVSRQQGHRRARRGAR